MSATITETPSDHELVRHAYETAREVGQTLWADERKDEQVTNFVKITKGGSQKSAMINSNTRVTIEFDTHGKDATADALKRFGAVFKATMPAKSPYPFIGAGCIEVRGLVVPHLVDAISEKSRHMREFVAVEAYGLGQADTAIVLRYAALKRLAVNLLPEKGAVSNRIKLASSGVVTALRKTTMGLRQLVIASALAMLSAADVIAICSGSNSLRHVAVYDWLISRSGVDALVADLNEAKHEDEDEDQEKWVLETHRRGMHGHAVAEKIVLVKVPITGETAEISAANTSYFDAIL